MTHFDSPLDYQLTACGTAGPVPTLDARCMMANAPISDVARRFSDSEGEEIGKARKGKGSNR
jgi:hypothetical protein